MKSHDNSMKSPSMESSPMVISLFSRHVSENHDLLILTSLAPRCFRVPVVHGSCRPSHRPCPLKSATNGCCPQPLPVRQGPNNWWMKWMEDAGETPAKVVIWPAKRMWIIFFETETGIDASHIYFLWEPWRQGFSNICPPKNENQLVTKPMATRSHQQMATQFPLAFTCSTCPNETGSESHALGIFTSSFAFE